MDMKNIGVWIDGASSSWQADTLRDKISTATNQVDRQISEHEDKIKSYHLRPVKKTSGKVYHYWMSCINGVWKHIGKDDPRPPLEKKVKSFKEKKSKIKNRMNSCVISKHGDHLIIDILKYKKHVGGAMPKNFIKMGDVEKLIK